MNSKVKDLSLRLSEEHSLKTDEYEYLLENFDEESYLFMRELAVKERKKYYGNKIFIRGLIEVSNICKKDCYYCGIRKSNRKVDRYRLGISDIVESAKRGYAIGFRTFVMQGGEDSFFTDEVLEEIITQIKSNFSEVAVTLSLGERTKESYLRLKKAGADRYLLRHETYDSEHYGKLHPSGDILKNRLECLRNLREAGFYVGCGFMVGSPYQTNKIIAKDLKFIEEFKPEMCGIGPFISQKDTPFKDKKNGSAILTCYLISIIRLINPTVLLPATTALGSVVDGGREEGILSGANVVMPNISPIRVRDKYKLYDGKLSTGVEGMEGLNLLSEKMKNIGYEVVISRGDISYSKEEESSDFKEGEK